MSIKEHPPQSNHRLHVPVLLERCLQLLDPKPNETYLDLTAGYGGHARAVLERTHLYDEAVLVDRDTFALETLDDLKAKDVRLLHLDFLAAARQLVEEGRRFDIILADLGVSSPQLDRQARGFSFKSPGPLDMRMDQRQERTAADIVNTYGEDELTQLITTYGEESRPVARRIAQAIVSGRPFETTGELAATIQATYRRPHGKIHPATRTFQALRIAVNDELRQVEELLPLLPGLLNPGGRVGIISFHSLEDRLVKRYFAEQTASGYEAELDVLTKRPISGATDDVHNPRARSAKLRVAVKK